MIKKLMIFSLIYCTSLNAQIITRDEDTEFLKETLKRSLCDARYKINYMKNGQPVSINRNDAGKNISDLITYAEIINTQPVKDEYQKIVFSKKVKGWSVQLHLQKTEIPVELESEAKKKKKCVIL